MGGGGRSGRFFEKKLRKKLFLRWTVVVSRPVARADNSYFVATAGNPF
jgi:hypothetical protein